MLNMVIGIFLVENLVAKVLFVLGTTHSLISINLKIRIKKAKGRSNKKINGEHPVRKIINR